jgi:hypothetical protein
MATWKKIIVSGSNAELAQVTASVGVLVGSNQVIGTTQAATRLTGSFTGSFTGGFSGDGTGLTGLTATATFPTIAITNLASTDKFFVNDDAGDLTSGNKKFTYGNLLTDLAGSGISVEATDSLSVNSGSMQTFFNSSSYAGISGDVLVNPTTGVATIQANSVALGTDTTGEYVTSVSASGALVSSALSGEGSTPNITLNTASTTFTSGVVSALPTGTVSGSSFSSPTQGTVRATINGVNTDVDTGLQTGDSPQFVGLTLTGDLAVNGGDVTTSATTFNIALTNATTINVGTTGATAVNIGGGASTTTVNNKLVVTGDLVVNGTTTTVDTTNLTIEDKFALFASGSDTNTDGGIIVQQSSTDGYALGVDASADRWALQNNLGPTATVLTPDAYMGVIQQWANAGAQPVSPQYGGATGFGTIGVQIDTGDVWIYS